MLSKILIVAVPAIWITLVWLAHKAYCNKIIASELIVFNYWRWRHRVLLGWCVLFGIGTGIIMAILLRQY